MALRRGSLDDKFGEWDLVPFETPTRTLSLDYETFCELDLKAVGLDRYSSHKSCEVLMCAFQIDDGEIEHWDATRDPMPKKLLRALLDDDFEIWAFNAQFERVITNRVLKIVPAIHRWRCTMALAYMHSFFGGLGDVAAQMGIRADKSKMATGTRLIGMFCKPQKLTRNNPHKRFTSWTHPVEWRMFVEYNVRDVLAENEIKRRLNKRRYFIPKREWEFYALDQLINDRGLPIDVGFVENALEMSNRRKAELLATMRDLTGLSNPGSPAQLLPWLQDRGYPLGDLKKDSVKKVLTAYKALQKGELEYHEGEIYPDELTKRAVKVLKLRQQQARSSTSKYAALLAAVGEDGRMRYVFQFAGASRTGRFAGRRFQPQNLTTLRGVDSEKILMQITQAIRDNDYDAVCMYKVEPLDALAGLVRSSVRATRRKRLVVCDYSSIESVVIGWVARCKRLLRVFEQGLDAYKDFATELFGVAYEEVTKDMRKMAKPATLGAGYRLGGGDIIDGKKTGLWGYGENMGVDMSRKQAHKSVKVFRSVYHEIPKCWKDLEEAIRGVLRDKTTERSVGPVTFFYEKPYLVCQLPSGRCIYYFDPKIVREVVTGKDPDTGERYEYVRQNITYMGKAQNSSKWVRVYSHGGKFIENIVQAIARDILREGMLACHYAGFNIVMHIHDEIVAENDDDDEEHNFAAMRAQMVRKKRWMKYNGIGMPLGAAGSEMIVYRKD